MPSTFIGLADLLPGDVDNRNGLVADECGDGLSLGGAGEQGGAQERDGEG